MGDCVFIEVETEDTLFRVCAFIEVETEDTIFSFVLYNPKLKLSIKYPSWKKASKFSHAHEPTKGTRQGYHSTMYKYETCN